MNFISDEDNFNFTFNSREDFWNFLKYFRTNELPSCTSITFNLDGFKYKMDFNDLEF